MTPGSDSAAPSPAHGTATVVPPKPDEPHAQGLSELLSRVLEQLSATSWLPSAMLVGNGALLVMFQWLGRVSPVEVVGILVRQPVASIFVWLFALVLITIIAQAFERQAVFALEGDWSSFGVPGMLRRWRVSRNLRHRDRLETRFQEVNTKIIDQVRRISAEALAVANSPHSNEERLTAVARLIRWEELTDVPESLEDNARTIAWERFCDPRLYVTRSRLRTVLDDYPEDDWEVLPTRLGNRLTAGYNRLAALGAHETDFVISNIDHLSSRLRRNHDVSRGRLDMYCSLVFVYVGLAAAAQVVLRLETGNPDVHIGISEMTVDVICGIYLVLAWLNYQAALRAADFFIRTLDSARRQLLEAGRL